MRQQGEKKFLRPEATLALHLSSKSSWLKPSDRRCRSHLLMGLRRSVSLTKVLDCPADTFSHVIPCQIPIAPHCDRLSIVRKTLEHRKRSTPPIARANDDRN